MSDDNDKNQGDEGKGISDDESTPEAQDGAALEEGLERVVRLEMERIQEQIEVKEAESVEESPDIEEEEAENKVIDLDAVRKQFEQVSQGLNLNLGIKDQFRDTVRQYLLENVVPKQQKSGTVDLRLDADFLKTHGRALLATFIQNVANSIFPQSIDFSVPLDESEAGSSKEGKGLERAGIGLEEAGAGLEEAGAGLEEAGSGLEDAGMGLEKAGEGLEEAGDPAEGESVEVGRDQEKSKAEEEPDVKIAVDIDLVQLLKGLFSPRKES